MRYKLNITLVVAACLLASLAVPSRADEVAEKGREVFKKNQHAVVTVQEVRPREVDAVAHGLKRA